MISDTAIIKNFYGIGSKNPGHKQIAESGLSNQKKEDRINEQFFHGDEAAYTHELGHGTTKLAVCFNRVRPFVHSFAGFAAQNRRVPEFFAIDKDDEKRQQGNEVANRGYSWMRGNANADQVETEQDKVFGIKGYGAVTKEIDYMDNPDGQIKYFEVTRDYWWDPTASSAGLTDRTFEYIRKKIEPDTAIKRFGGKEEDYEEATRDTHAPFRFWREGGVYDRIAFDWVGTHEPKLVYIYEYHWFELENYWRIFNPIFKEELQANGKAQALLAALDRMKELRIAEAEQESTSTTNEYGDNEVEDLFQFDPRKRILSLNKEQYDDFKAIAEELDIEFDSDKNLRKVYYEAVLSGSSVFKKRKAIDQSAFAVNVKTADYDHHRRVWHGLVSSLREPARYANAALTKFLLILASTSGPGYFYDLTMIDDVDKFEDQASKNATALGINGNPNVAIRDKQQPALPNGYDTLYPLFLQALPDSIGFAPEALGLGDLSQPSFELEQQRIKQVMTTLAVYFDAITLYQKQDAKSCLYYQRRLVRNNEGRPIPFIDDKGEQSIAELYSNMISEEYSIDIGEAPDTPTKRKEQGAIMQNFADKIATTAPQLANKAYALAVNTLPITLTEKSKWRDMLDPEPDPQQVQQQQEEQARQKELQETAIMTDLEKTQSETAKNQASTEKTLAEVDKVEAETDKVDLETVIASTNPLNEVNINL